MNRGDIAIVDFTATNPAAGIRPALIVQNDVDNARMQNTIVAQITGNVSHAHEATQYLIDATHPDWTASGLRRPSVVNCSALGQINQNDVRHVIGSLSAATMVDVSDCLRAALDLN